MKWKTTVVLLLLTLGVATYIALYDIKQPLPEEQRELATQVVDLKPDRITGLLIKVPAFSVTLERHDATWHLTSPLASRAESSFIQRIVTLLHPLHASRTLTPASKVPLTLKDYGLDPAQATLTVLQGSTSTTLFFGEKSAVGESRYLKRADRPDVFVIDAELFDAINQPLDQYRSHALLSVDPWHVDQLRLTRGETTTILVKEPAPKGSSEPATWRITEPFADEADRTAVSALLSKLRNVRIERFLNDAPTADQRAAWGLEAPASRIHLTFGTPPETQELIIGHALPDQATLVAVARDAEPSVYAVTSTELDAVFADPKTLRSKACFAFFPTEVTAVQVTWQGASWKLERRNEQWLDAQGHAVDPSKFDIWLASLRDVRLARFLDVSGEQLPHVGLEPPQGSIAVWLADHPEPVRLDIGGPIEPGTTRYGRLPQRQVVVELPYTINDLIGTTLDAFKPEPAPAPKPAPSIHDAR